MSLSAPSDDEVAGSRLSDEEAWKSSVCPVCCMLSSLSVASVGSVLVSEEEDRGLLAAVLLDRPSMEEDMEVVEETARVSERERPTRMLANGDESVDSSTRCCPPRLVLGLRDRLSLDELALLPEPSDALFFSRSPLAGVVVLPGVPWLEGRRKREMPWEDADDSGVSAPVKLREKVMGLFLGAGKPMLSCSVP